MTEFAQSQFLPSNSGSSTTKLSYKNESVRDFINWNYIQLIA